MPRSIFLVALLSFFTLNLPAQDVIKVLVNGKNAGQASVMDKPVVITVKKNDYKNISNLTCIIHQGKRNEVFKRTLEVTNADMEILYSLRESTNKKEQYRVNIPVLKKKVLNQKIIKIFLSEDPANEMMAVRSSKKLLAEIHFK